MSYAPVELLNGRQLTEVWNAEAIARAFDSDSVYIGPDAAMRNYIVTVFLAACHMFKDNEAYSDLITPFASDNCPLDERLWAVDVARLFTTTPDRLTGPIVDMANAFIYGPEHTGPVYHLDGFAPFFGL